MVERRALPRPPRMEIDEPARLWMIKHARENYWRVAHWIGLDDLISDGLLTWYRIVEGEKLAGPRQAGDAVSSMVAYRYITSRPHIMSLFQSAYRNHITDLANGRTQRASFEIPTEDYMDAPDDPEYPSMAGAPIEVRRVLDVLNTEDGCAEMAKEYVVHANGTRETTNERLQRLTGLSGKITSAIKSYLGVEVRRPAPKPQQSAYSVMRQEGKNPLLALAFSCLDKLNKRIEAERGDGLQCVPKPVKRAIACGALLIQAKEICKKNGVSFIAWIVDNCNFCASTARKYMWLARHSAKLGNILSSSLAAARRHICASIIPAV